MNKSGVIIIILAVSAMALTGAEYPVDKGAYTVGGNFGLGYFGGDIYGNSSPSFLLDLNGYYQYFALPGLAWGIMVRLDYLKYGNDIISTLEFGPSLALYLGGKGSKYYPFIKSFFTIGRMNLQGISGNNKDAMVYEFGGSLGVARFVTRNLALTGTLDYVHGRYEYHKAEDVFEENKLRFSLGLGIFMY